MIVSRCLASLALLAFAGCSPEVTFPTNRPVMRQAGDDVAAGQLPALAEAGATNCGVAMTAAAANRVYECASRALAEHHPFYCRYPEPRSYGFRGAWLWPIGYVGMSDGRVYAVVRRDQKLSLGALVLDRTTPPALRRVHHGMRPPELLSSGGTVANDAALAQISGIVILETTIRADGSVAETRVLKALPHGADRLAESLVRRATFRPAHFFGVPVPVLFNVTVQLEGGTLRVTNPR